MDLSYTPEQEALRRRARAWLARNVPRGARRGRSVEYGEPERISAAKGWQRKVYMFTLGMIIGGGTSQIQKNIISERGLGMPRG